MTNRRGQRADQRGEIEMPPLDYQYPAEMGVPQAASEAAPTPVEEKPLYHEQVYEQESSEEPVEQEEQTSEQETVEELEQDEPEVEPTSVDTSLSKEKKQKTKEENFREVRLAKERAERERDALMSQMLEMQAKLQAQRQAEQPQQQPIVEEKDWFDEIDPESLVEGKQVKKIAEDMRAMKKLLHEQQVQAQQLAMEAKIKSQYPDFEQVFNADNIQQLNNNYPEIAQALRGMSDDYGKATAAYTMIKNLGIAKGNEMKKKTYESDILKAKVNAAKPRPLTSVNPQQGDSPLSKANAFANGLTPDLKAQMLKEMQAARKAH